MKHAFLLLLTFIAANTLYSQPKYPVPGAQVQPQWVFPIWFEDGNGDRDTVYFCYDPDATDHGPNSPFDTLFGEYYIQKDSGKFWVGLDGSLHNHLALNADVFKNSGTGIVFNKGVYPLKIYWDVSLLNSPDLPYPDNSPQPRARIDIFCDDLFRNCPWDRGIVIHGDSLLHGSNYFPTYKDSMVFQGDPNAPVGFTLGHFGLKLKSYNAPLPVGISKIKAFDYVLYPNPVCEYLTVTLPEALTVHWSIYDYTGAKLLQAEEDAAEESFLIHVHSLKAGLYILRLSFNNQSISKPFIKQ